MALCIFTDKETVDKTLDFPLSSGARGLIPLKQKEMSLVMAQEATEGEAEFLKMLEESEKGNVGNFIPKEYEAKDFKISIRHVLVEAKKDADERRNPKGE